MMWAHLLSPGVLPMTDTLDTLTVAAAVERQKLQRHFGRFDILFFLICTIVGVDTVAAVAQSGGGPGPRTWTWPQNRRPPAAELQVRDQCRLEGFDD
jgi:hypothetical protein